MISSPCPQIQIAQEDKVLRIQLNRPERKNALSLAMYAALADVISAAGQEPSVRVLVLTGSQGVFTSGNDLMDFMNDPDIREGHPTVRFMSELQNCPKPVVAIVEGHAVGIGTTLLLHCDLVFAADDAKLQLPFVNLGLCPEYASSYLLPRLIGQQKAAELLLLGEAFSGKEAASFGFVNTSVPIGELAAYANAKIQRLANQPPGAVRASKALLRQTQHAAVNSAMAAEFLGFTESLKSEECRESVTAFFEKRAPDFSRF